MSSTRDDRAWRRIAIGSFGTLLCVALAWNAAAYAIDESGLAQGVDSWGLFFGSLLSTVIYGGVPILIALVLAVVAGLGIELARPCAWCGAAIAAVCAVALMLATALLITGPPAEAAFAVVSALLALPLLAPGFLCIRQASHEPRRG